MATPCPQNRSSMFGSFKSAKSTFKNAISTLTLNLFSPKMSSDESPILPAHQMHIQSYITTLEALNNAKGTDELAKWKVENASHFKSKKKVSQHEYVRTTVRSPRGETAFLAFERLGGEHTSISGASPDTSPPPLNRSSSSVSSSLGNFLAQDTVTPLKDAHGKWHKDDILVGTLIFSEKEPPLHEVALLAGTIHDAGTSYLLFSNNCYHYSGTMMCTLHAKYSPIQEIPEDANAGSWCGIELDMPSTNKLSQLLTSLEERAEKFVSLFSMSSK